MIVLQPLGFYRELGLHDWNGPLTAVIAAEPVGDEDRIVKYLLQGVIFAAATYIARDVLSPDHIPIGPQHLRTDGRWVWPATLSYYLTTYHCRLPQQFQLELQAKNWKFPVVESIDLTQLELPKRG